MPQIKKEPTYKIETIENDEIGLYENEVLIYKSNNGAVLGLTEISFEDIPEDVEKSFFKEVYENTVAKKDSKIEIVIEDVVIEAEPIITVDTKLEKNKKTKKALSQEMSLFNFLDNNVA